MAAANLVAASADIALIIDEAGRIQDIVQAGKATADGLVDEWRGRAWVDTVTGESRAKVEDLLREARADASTRWREVNHTRGDGIQLPVRYSAIRLGSNGTILALGRDLSMVSDLQQRVLDVQRSMERENARLRHAETRYRLLFQLSDEVVVIVDAATSRIVDANPAAARVFATPVQRAIGRPLAEMFEDVSVPIVRDALVAARMASRPDPVFVQVTGQPKPFALSASQFRQDGAVHVLVRLVPEAADDRGEGRAATSRVLAIVDRLPDAFVVTDAERRVLDVNAAFLELAELSGVEQVRGQNLDRWLGRGGADMPVLVSNLREHGAVRGFGTVMRGEFGSTEEVEVSAVSALEAEVPCLGFVLRRLARAASPTRRVEGQLPRSPDQLTDLIGRMPLKQIVTETTDVIERMCIEATLKLTRDNRASAAQMLGLSRQSLYAKLRRYGLGGSDT